MLGTESMKCDHPLGKNDRRGSLDPFMHAVVRYSMLLVHGAVKICPGDSHACTSLEASALLARRLRNPSASFVDKPAAARVSVLTPMPPPRSASFLVPTPDGIACWPCTGVAADATVAEEEEAAMLPAVATHSSTICGSDTPLCLRRLLSFACGTQRLMLHTR